MPDSPPTLDALDLDLITVLTEHPRAGVLELSRLLRVARGTVQARLQRLESGGVITGYGPDINVEAAGYPVQAFVTLEIAQGALDEVRAELEQIPDLLEGYATTGVGDVLCRIAAPSHEDLQRVLLRLNRSRYVVRSTSVVALSVVVPYRVLPLLRAEPRSGPGRAPAYRRDGPEGAEMLARDGSGAAGDRPPAPRSARAAPSCPGVTRAATNWAPSAVRR